MTEEALKDLIEKVQRIGAETQHIEVKAAHQGCPNRLYDTLSSFSNQDEGGTILFGLDESQDFASVGVYDAQDLQKRVMEQCGEMEPLVRPLFTVLESQGKVLVSAEIPAIDLSERPCFYRGKGRIRGAYCRVGDADMPMTEYEVYSFEAYRKKYQDDIRTVNRADRGALDENLLNRYLVLLKAGKPNLAMMSDERIMGLMGVLRDNLAALWAILLFSPYPQAYFPQLSVIATVVPGEDVGDVDENGVRFLDNRRIEGNLEQMLEESMNFVRANMQRQTIIDENGRRIDRTDYPLKAVREILINALVHRDYSIHTEGMPVQLIMYSDRLEVRSPGGLYGRIRLDQLGKMQPDTRNPALANALEVLGVTENRYSGIPTIYREARLHGIKEPEFADERGSFVVRMYKRKAKVEEKLTQQQWKLLEFCETPRKRREIAEFFGLTSVSYAIRTHVQPLVQMGLLEMTLPEAPSSSKQEYVATRRE